MRKFIFALFVFALTMSEISACSSAGGAGGMMAGRMRMRSRGGMSMYASSSGMYASTVVSAPVMMGSCQSNMMHTISAPVPVPTPLVPSSEVRATNELITAATTAAPPSRPLKKLIEVVQANEAATANAANDLIDAVIATSATEDLFAIIATNELINTSIAPTPR